jgi:hypothetical protein
VQRLRILQVGPVNYVRLRDEEVMLKLFKAGNECLLVTAGGRRMRAIITEYHRTYGLNPQLTIGFVRTDLRI